MKFILLRDIYCLSAIQTELMQQNIKKNAFCDIIKYHRKRFFISKESKSKLNIYKLSKTDKKGNFNIYNI